MCISFLVSHLLHVLISLHIHDIPCNQVTEFGDYDVLRQSQLCHRLMFGPKLRSRVCWPGWYAKQQKGSLLRVQAVFPSKWRTVGVF